MNGARFHTRRFLFALGPWLSLLAILDAIPGLGVGLLHWPFDFLAGFLAGIGFVFLWVAGLSAVESGWLGWVRAFAMGVSVTEPMRGLDDLMVGGARGWVPRSWSGFAIYLLTCAALAVVFYLLAFHRQEAERQRQLAEEAHLQSLRAKLAPHFIFNTLSTLKAQIREDPGGAEAMTDRLAALFRQVVERSDALSIPLQEELGFVEAYLGIEQVRFGERLKVRIEVPEELESSGVPPLSLQVLVENAVKHGIAPLERGGEIRIAARKDGNDLILEVSDPGNGLGVEPGTGTALETLRSRLARPSDLNLARADGRTVASFRWRQA